jgi:acylphosphatase
MGEKAALKAVVSGRVQGVFFRAFVAAQANLLHLSGYVRNLSENQVEVVAEGDKPDVEKLIGYLQQGPPTAQVDDVTVQWTDYRGEFTGFKIKY